MEYFGIFINNRTNWVDPSVALRTFFGSLNNIMSVLGHGRHELLAVPVVKSYCLPILLYGCEIGRTSVSDKHKVDVVWNNCFRKQINTC